LPQAPVPLQTLPPAAAPAPAPGTPQAAPAPAPAPAPASAEPQGNWTWLWLAIPAALGLVAFFALGRRRPRRAARAEARRDFAAAEPAAPPAAEPAAPPAVGTAVRPAAPPRPAPAAAAQAGPRAELEVQFLPARAAATDVAATVEFEFVLKNVGEVPASNIRIDTRMFNASARKDVAEFLKGPIHERSGSPHVAIPPGGELRLTSAIALPKEQVRVIEMQGRQLFVPVVASIVAWDWAGDGTARVSLSWLLGREAETPSAKMGGFRLDLGPRIYRHVGVRPMTLVA
jgi:hypothetical protein